MIRNNTNVEESDTTTSENVIGELGSEQDDEHLEGVQTLRATPQDPTTRLEDAFRHKLIFLLGKEELKIKSSARFQVADAARMAWLTVFLHVRGQYKK